MTENEQLKTWLNKSRFKDNHNEFVRYIGAPNATVWGWLNRNSKISNKYRDSLFFITQLECFTNQKSKNPTKKESDRMNIKKINEFIDAFNNLVLLLKYFEEAKPEERKILKNALDDKRNKVAYINNLLRLMFDEYKFQEWKKNNELLK